jgi:hypothetical protein
VPLKNSFVILITNNFRRSFRKRIFQRTEEQSSGTFKIKQNGIFRARLVAFRNSQIPGIDFIESFAPLINDVSFRIILISKLIWKLEASIAGVKTAFLHGELQEEIYKSYDSKIFSVSKESLWACSKRKRVLKKVNLYT